MNLLAVRVSEPPFYLSVIMYKMNKKLYLLLNIVLLSLITSAVFFFFYRERKTQVLKVSFLDVGQGDSIYIKSPSGKDMIIDGGPDKRVLARLSREMDFFDRGIDIVIASHGDQDHITGLVEVVNRYKVGVYIEPLSEKDSEVLDELHKTIEQKNIKKIYAVYGQKIDLGEGVICTIIHPGIDSIEYDANDSSIVLLIEYGEISFLLTGDASIKSENQYLKYLEHKSVTVLKAGHHGSDTSTSESLLEKITPEYVIFSAGKDNKYGHPSISVIDRVKNYKSKILNTYEIGNINFESDGQTVTVK